MTLQPLPSVQEGILPWAIQIDWIQIMARERLHPFALAGCFGMPTKHGACIVWLAGQVGQSLCSCGPHTLLLKFRCMNALSKMMDRLPCIQVGLSLGDLASELGSLSYQ